MEKGQAKLKYSPKAENEKAGEEFKKTLSFELDYTPALEALELLKQTGLGEA